MKKKIIILSLSMLLIGNININAIKKIDSEEWCGRDELIYRQDVYNGNVYSVSNNNLYNYFYNLRSNFGNNLETEATCGYVAIGMLLNYYDTFINGNIVESKYQVNANFSTLKLNLINTESPGTYYIPHSNDLYPNMVNDSTEYVDDVYGYLNYLRLFTDYGNYHQKSLHAYLTLLGTDSLVSNNQGLCHNNFREAFETNGEIIKETINKYFLNLPTNFDYNIQHKYYMENKSNVSSPFDVYDFIMEEIDDGRPVLIGFNGHASIAYDYYYDGMDFQLITHDGYVNRYYYEDELLRRELINYATSPGISAISIVFDNDIIENPGYNYHSILYNDDNTYNGLFINHFTHIYGYDYLNYNSMYHRTYCKCNLNQLELHDYKKDLLFTGEYCKCGEENPMFIGGLLKNENEEEE